MSKFNHLKLKSIIVESGQEQNQIATHLGIHYNTINAWVNGGHSPRMPKLFSVLEAVGFTSDQIGDMRFGDFFDLTPPDNGQP